MLIISEPTMFTWWCWYLFYLLWILISCCQGSNYSSWGPATSRQLYTITNITWHYISEHFSQHVKCVPSGLYSTITYCIFYYTKSMCMCVWAHIHIHCITLTLCKYSLTIFFSRVDMHTRTPPLSLLSPSHTVSHFLSLAHSILCISHTHSPSFCLSLHSITLSLTPFFPPLSLFIPL